MRLLQLLRQLNESDTVWYRGGPPMTDADPISFFTTDKEGADWFTREKGGDTRAYNINARNVLDIDSDAGMKEYFATAKRAGIDFEITGSPYDGENGRASCRERV